MSWRTEKAIWVTLCMVLINVVAAMVFIYCTKMDYLYCLAIQVCFILMPTYFVAYGAIEDAVKSHLKRKQRRNMI